MRLNAIIRLILAGIALAGLTNLTLLVHTLSTENQDQDLFMRLLDQHEFSLYLGIASLALLLGLIIHQLLAAPGKRFYDQYQHIDSEKLDSDKKSAQQFYRAALRYRIKHGRYAYRKCILNRFNFFYDYHNYALNWIDDIVSSQTQDIISEHFILAVIQSGHIGRVFTSAHYAAGLPDSNLKPGAALLFHDCSKGIQVWSYQSHKPLCQLDKKSVKLQQAHRHPNYLSAILHATTVHRQVSVQLELRFMTLASQGNKYKRSENIARQSMLDLNQWLHEASETHSRHPISDGIDVTEIVGTESIFKTPLNKKLEQLVYRKIDAFYPRSRLPVSDPSIALDAVMLCNGVGIILITEKHEQGDITYSGDPDWYQFIKGNGFHLQNPCLASQLAKSSLANLLAAHNLTRWPIQNVVVFSKDNVKLNKSIGKARIQCDVIRLDHMENWLDSLPRQNDILFTQEDIERFNQLMKPVQSGLKKSGKQKTSIESLLNPA